MFDPISQLRNAMHVDGLIAPEHIERGKIQRFPGADKSASNKAGWCKVFDDGNGAVYGDYSTGLSASWQARRETPYSQAEREAHKRQIAEARAQREADEKVRHAEAATKAAELLQVATPAPDDFPYLDRKGIKASGARLHDGKLVIPMRDGGKLCSLQIIDADGGKKFLPGGRVTGCYFSIGSLKGAVTLCICEGFATGASIHEATGLPVAVAFNAGNLEAVAKALRAKFPELPLIICADDDIQTAGNPGMSKATAAARAVGALLAVPDFGTDRPDGATDFNDMAQLCGEEAVRQAVTSAKAPAVGELKAGDENSTEGDCESLHDAVTRLAALHPLEYEKIRESEAQRLGARVGVLDKEVSTARRSKQEDGGKAAMFPTVEPWPEPVNANQLLQQIYSTIQRFIVCDRKTAVAATLWITFTWFMDSVEIAPIAVITAPEKRCGKTQLLILIGKLSFRPLVASNIGAAAVFRVIEAHYPTLLIDEADSFFKDNEELRGVINSGHTRQSAYVIRCVGDDHEPRQFSTWGAKAISGIGHLADTLMDRSIILELRRKLPTESIKRLRHAEPGLFDRLASKLARFAQDAAPAISRSRPPLPEALNDRAQDNWEPLLAIADYAGGDWPRLARDTALKLSGSEQESVSLPAELLADIQHIFEIKHTDKISTADLIVALCDDDEAAWSTYNRGKPITPRQVSSKLVGYGIASKTIRIGYGTVKGFEKSQFSDAFTRYLAHPVENAHFAVTPSQPSNGRASDVTNTKSVTVTNLQKVTLQPLETLDCDVVTDITGVSSGVVVEVTV